MKKNDSSEIPFIKFHKVLSLLFNPSEVIFILHMLDIESLKKQGHKIEWTRGFYMARMGMTPYTFDKCIETLLAIDLLTKTNNTDGNKVYYSLNMDLYTRLVQILSANKNVYTMIDFCKKNFKSGNRKIESITDEEIIELSNLL